MPELNCGFAAPLATLVAKALANGLNHWQPAVPGAVLDWMPTVRLYWAAAALFATAKAASPATPAACVMSSITLAWVMKRLRSNKSSLIVRRMSLPTVKSPRS